MTAYWDDLKREVREASQLGNDDFVETVIEIESRAIQAVTLVTGDREFPDELRQKVLNVIALNAIDYGWHIYGKHVREGDALKNERARAWLLTMRYSILIEELHSTFHLVAAQRAPNRYDGFFSDDPTSFLRARDAIVG